MCMYVCVYIYIYICIMCVYIYIYICYNSSNSNNCNDTDNSNNRIDNNDNDNNIDNSPHAFSIGALSWWRATSAKAAVGSSLHSGGCRCALVGVPWRGSVSARLAWGDVVSFKMLSKVLEMLSILRRQGTPMRAHLQLPYTSFIRGVCYADSDWADITYCDLRFQKLYRSNTPVTSRSTFQSQPTMSRHSKSPLMKHDCVTATITTVTLWLCLLTLAKAAAQSVLKLYQ